MSKKKPKISILVAAYNEEEIILMFLKNIEEMMDKMEESWEMIIVENGSKDKTGKIIKDYIKTKPHIILKQLPNPAYGKAMIEAFKKAEGEYSVFFNVDFWDKRFIEVCKVDLLGYDLICSSKLLRNSKDLRPLTRRIVTKLYNLFLQYFFGFKGTDTHGIKTFRTKTALQMVKKCKTETGIFDSELVIRCQRAGFKILELPVEVKEIRTTRFRLNRVLHTPFDIINLYKVLK